MHLKIWNTHFKEKKKKNGICKIRVRVLILFSCSMYSLACSSILYFGLHSVLYPDTADTKTRVCFWKGLTLYQTTEPKLKALADDKMNVPQLVISVLIG